MMRKAGIATIIMGFFFTVRSAALYFGLAVTFLEAASVQTERPKNPKDDHHDNDDDTHEKDDSSCRRANLRAVMVLKDCAHGPQGQAARLRTLMQQVFGEAPSNTMCYSLVYGYLTYQDLAEYDVLYIDASGDDFGIVADWLDTPTPSTKKDGGSSSKNNNNNNNNMPLLEQFLNWPPEPPRGSQNRPASQQHPKRQVWFNAAAPTISTTTLSSLSSISLWPVVSTSKGEPGSSRYIWKLPGGAQMQIQDQSQQHQEGYLMALEVNNNNIGNAADGDFSYPIHDGAMMNHSILTPNTTLLTTTLSGHPETFVKRFVDANNNNKDITIVQGSSSLNNLLLGTLPVVADNDEMAGGEEESAGRSLSYYHSWRVRMLQDMCRRGSSADTTMEMN